MTNFIGSFCPFLFDDLNTNRVWNTNELGGWQQPTPYWSRTGHTHSATLQPLDGDADDMPDFWERRRSLNWTNQADCVADPDGDGLYNIYEYGFGSNPWAADNTFTNTAVWAAIQGVDPKIAGKSPTNALAVFSVQNHAATNYVRNTNCWAYSYDLTCYSPWNNTETNAPWYRPGTLISPRHVIFAAHYAASSNKAIRFVDRQNNVVVRQIQKVMIHSNYVADPVWYPDLAVGLLDSDVPTNQISFAKVLPDNYASYLGSGIRIPVLALNHQHHASIFDIHHITQSPTNLMEAKLVAPIDGTRNSFYSAIGGGDSGNPVMLLVSGEPIILTVWSKLPGLGTSIVDFKSDINRMMYLLNTNLAYQLTEKTFSGFAPITP